MPASEIITPFIPTIQILGGGFLTLMGVFVAQRAATRRDWASRRLELAEEVLASLYEVRDAIRAIRSPLSWEGEGSTRKRGEHETEEQSRILDKAYISAERFDKNKEAFSRLQSKRYQFEAMFQGDVYKSFDEIAEAISEIMWASRDLGEDYWPQEATVGLSDAALEKHLEQRKALQMKIWNTGRQDDEIQKKVNSAIFRVEAVVSKASRVFTNTFFMFGGR